VLKDITIGQYFPGNSIIHRLDSRFKIILTTMYIIMVFSADSFIGTGICAVYAFAAYIISDIKFSLMWKNLKAVIPIISITAVMNLFFIDGKPIFKIGFIQITYEAVESSLFMIFRILLLIIGSSLLTYTTSPVNLTDAIERLLSPLKKIKVPVHEFAMMMSIALRFVPTLIDEADRIMSAQKARGTDFSSGSLIKRAKALIPIIIPLFVSAFRRADELATAMECRCYHGGEGRTKLRVTHMRFADFLALILMVVFGAAIVMINIHASKYGIGYVMP